MADIDPRKARVGTGQPATVRHSYVGRPLVCLRVQEWRVRVTSVGTLVLRLHEVEEGQR